MTRTFYNLAMIGLLLVVAACSPPVSEATFEIVSPAGYGAMQDGDFLIPAVAPHLFYEGAQRAEVVFNGDDAPGTIVVDTFARRLYYVQQGGMATRYAIAVGREGISFRGSGVIGRKAEWPSWTPPAAMLKRRPDLPRFMNGGINNPLGARALYLYNGGRDTLFRIHGTNEPWTIGQAVSSGCIRMMNDDVMDLYSRVRVGASVRMI